MYLTAADASGVMVSMIQSNYLGFGSGVVVPGTGIALHNRGANFVATPGHPNQVGPGKRPYHTIIPGFVTKDGTPVMSFGVMGGPMQPQGHVQVVVRIVDHDQNPQAACDGPGSAGCRACRSAASAAFRRPRSTSCSGVATNWLSQTTTTSSVAARRSGGSTTATSP
ncbi:gamma-glutamyltranspeptidase family protein [Mycobacterium xenopi 3993]|nr:gamma-glutamyltranspeptidase family protein [Mycobacterium xenopi 3993]